MKKNTKYRCNCGWVSQNEGDSGLREFRQHLYQFSAKEKGKHWKVTEKSVLVKATERLALTPSSVTEAPPPAIKIVKETQSISAGKWLSIMGGLVLLLAGGATIYFGNTQHQSIIIIAGFILFALGAFVGIRGLRWRGGDSLLGRTKGNVPSDTIIPKPKGTENCLNIYSDRIEFAITENPTGIPRQCENDKQWYYVNIWDSSKGTLIPHLLPDTKFYDPKVFAQVVEAEPVRKFFEIRFVTLEKIAVWTFIAALGLGIVAVIIVPGVFKGG